MTPIFRRPLLAALPCLVLLASCMEPSKEEKAALRQMEVAPTVNINEAKL